MKFSRSSLIAVIVLAIASPLIAQEQSLLDVAADGVEARFKTSSDQLKVARDNGAILVTVQPGQDGYPGIDLAPEGGAWDLSKFGHVVAEIENPGDKPLNVSLRLDNAGNWKDNPWNAESSTIKPGMTGTVKVIFGYAYGYKPNYKLNPAAVANLKLFLGKPATERSFRIVSIKAAGPAGEKPAVDPASIRIKPVNGVLLGAEVELDLNKNVNAKGATAAVEGKAVRATFAGEKGEQVVTVKPATGRWDLSHYLEVKVKVTNAGTTPATPRVRVESNKGATKWVTGSELAPSAEAEISIPFGDEIWDGEKKNSGSQLGSDSVSGVSVSATGSGTRVLEISNVTAVVPEPKLPDWLGQRPPVDGEWTKTFDENFDGSAIDYTKWNIYTENYWDKRTRFSKDNLFVENGMAKLRYTKSRGHDSDDPAKKETDYAAGYLDTFGKWTQRYGYFEARTKLPTAPGLWPAFWMMPDRGYDLGPQWKRSDTKFGAMELDILEHLTRWGPYRYNIALHWDGYQKEHKANGTDRIYAQTDKDGYMTTGVLWTPGNLAYYCNGQLVAKWENERISNVPSYIIFTLVSGGWDNNPIDDSRFPDDFIVDYVRCWQRKDLASEVDGPKNAPATPGKVYKPSTQPAAR